MIDNHENDDDELIAINEIWYQLIKCEIDAK